MAKEAHGSLASDADAIEATAEDIESRITTAMHSRVGHFKEQADSLTFEGVRRLLEKDLGLETFALDVQKRFVKQCLLKCLDGANEDGSKSSCETVEKNVSTTTEGTESPKEREPKKEVKEPCSEDEEKLDGSPVLGLLAGHKTTKVENKETKEVSESTIQKAIRKRASYLEANSDKVTMAGLRRLLEEDLTLDKFTLDPYKKFISGKLDEVLKSCEVSAAASEVKKKKLNKKSLIKPSKKVNKKMNSASSGRKTKNFEGLKKRKIPKIEAEMPSKKRSKHTESNSDDNSDEETVGVSLMMRKETSAPVHGKRVEHLKSVIKLCGMSVPPSIYKRVKQVPENKREAQLIKELEDILSKEGLSANPSEKEVKDVRKRKERAKELEGIDTEEDEDSD
ncbi:hypothetical protein GOBAR_DD23047 [Gossypium barbadense]|nr:hypothetical protein GOBAR_DD23047 [Gossypium barbadense]